MYTIHDNGQHDPIKFVLSDTDQAIARITNRAIRAHREALNAHDNMDVDGAKDLAFRLLAMAAEKSNDRDLTREIAGLRWRMGPGQKLTAYLFERGRHDTLGLPNYEECCAAAGVDANDSMMRARVAAMLAAWRPRGSANDDHGPYTPAPAVAQQVMA